MASAGYYHYYYWKQAGLSTSVRGREIGDRQNFQDRFTNYFCLDRKSVRQRLSELFDSPQSILLTGNSSAQAIVRISAPESVSDEMLNQTIKITASFDVDDFPSTWL
jgi:hypothetical protein